MTRHHPSEEKLTQAQLKRELHYDPATGKFRRLRGRRRGLIAGSPNNCGYNQIRVRGPLYCAARLAFLYMRGRWPIEVDHRNLREGDDRWRNLREVPSHSPNMHNRRVRRDSRSRRKGVRRRENGRWQAVICVGGRRVGLGCYSTRRDAHRAYVRAARKHFGKFARA